jgi:hypothetical protein
MKLEFSKQIFENLKYQILLKSVQWEPGFSMQMDGWT